MGNKDDPRKKRCTPLKKGGRGDFREIIFTLIKERRK
jgi:hypothetical protein